MKYLLVPLLPIIAFCKPCLFFPRKVHQKALIKCGFLLAISTSPLTALLLFKHSETPQIYGELYVYMASFLSPVIYMLIERLIDYHEKIKEGEEATFKFQIFDGAFWVISCSILLIIFTAIGFGFYVSGEAKPAWANTYLVCFLLFCATYFWYLSVADSEFKGLDYSSSFRRETEHFLDTIIPRTQG